MKRLFFFGIILFFIASDIVNAQKSFDPEQVCISEEEYKLYNLVMAYREKNNLESIPLSKSLCYVAEIHAWDITENHPDKPGCNAHSWSDKGDWTPCCYTEDHKEASKMWNKPEELTGFKTYGFEIAYGSSDYPNFIVTAENALEGWKSSSGHNSVILNKNIWADWNWKSIGIAIKDNYACIWFSKDSDEYEVTPVCK